MSSTRTGNLSAPAASRHGFLRILSAVAGPLLFLAVVAGAAAAQKATPAGAHFELLVHSGRMVPTGALRDVVRDANLSAAQLLYVAHPLVAASATAGWARSRDISSPGDPRLDVFTYDIGVELRAPRLVTAAAVHVTAMLGIGAGGRSYNYRSLNVDATHNGAAYASIGGEIGYRRVRMRVETRDYVTGFKPLVGGGATDTRNDLTFLVGFRLTGR